MTPAARALALLLAATPSLAQVQARYGAALRTEGRARPATPGTDRGPVAADAEVTPSLRFALSSRTFELALGYAPTLRMIEPYAGRSFEHFHRAHLDATTRLSRGRRLFLTQTFGYGFLDYASLTAPGAPSEGPAPVQPLPELRGLRTLELDTSAGLELAPARGVGVLLSAGFFHGGGADAPSRRTLPLQQSPRAGIRVTQALSRTDALTGALQVRHAVFSNERSASVAELSGEWGRRFARHTRSELTAGVSAVRSQLGPRLEPILDVLPVAGVALDQLWPGRHGELHGRLALRASPFVDRFVGAAYERAEASGLLGARMGESVHVAAGGGYALTLSEGPQRGERAWFADLSAGYQPHAAFRLEASYRGNWIVRPELSGAPAVQWVCGLSAIFLTGDIL